MQDRESFMTASQLRKVTFRTEQRGGKRIPRSHHEMREITGVARPGKTAKDKATGAQARRLANRRARVEWQQENSKTRHNDKFPRDTCNGKKNHYIH